MKSYTADVGHCDVMVNKERFGGFSERSNSQAFLICTAPLKLLTMAIKDIVLLPRLVQEDFVSFMK
jgi:hypothetical protein